MPKRPYCRPCTRAYDARRRRTSSIASNFQARLQYYPGLRQPCRVCGAGKAWAFHGLSGDVPWIYKGEQRFAQFLCRTHHRTLRRVIRMEEKSKQLAHAARVERASLERAVRERLPS